MNYLSVCSGIEAATVGWHLLGLQAVAFSEIEPFPCAALAHHYPTVPNFGDMTKFKEWPDAAVNVLVGGTPCQSFSVAGLRKGLADPRGNLMLTYLAIAAKYRPKWVVWENVPGVLSSNGGLDFASFLQGLGECGYGFAYRVLDAQYFGVPQRRRRVFVVGHLGSWQRAAAVLFERHSLQGHPAPRREAGKRVAGTISKCSFDGGAGGRPKGAAAGHFQPVVMSTGQAGAEIGIGIGTTHEAPIVTHSLRGEGFDASEDGTGRGTPLVPVAIQGSMIGRSDTAGPAGPGFSEDGQSFTLAKSDQHSVAYSMITANTGANGLGVAAEVAPTLDRAQPCAVAFEPGIMGREGGHHYEEISGTLRKEPGDNQMAVAVAAFKGGQGSGAGSIGYSEHLAPTLPSADGGNRTPTLMQAMQVRRLTPQECERLQGFPDEYTQVPYRNKPAADGPRYKALGNSMAVPVMAWIGKRIQQVESI